MTGFMSH